MTEPNNGLDPAVDPRRVNVGLGQALARDRDGGAGLRVLKAGQHVREKGDQVLQPIRPAAQHYEGNVEGWQILLEGQVPINRDVHVEILLGQDKKPTI